ncbi:DUF4845 domain-containing protein [Pseudoxanthomonas sp.]|jgi:hypothetical protein|uniref:DUF4845 domain-containing protein n=1 Tax=Pseudoxanthomonas sp. TaxID=1871049 RepID=UPI003F80C967
MNHKRQSGITFIGFLIVLVVAGSAAFIAIKLFPMYQEYYAVRAAMRGLSEEPGVADWDPSRIQDRFFRRLAIDYTENVKPANVKFERADRGWKMRVAYEVRRPMVANLDVVGKFDSTQELTLRSPE